MEEELKKGDIAVLIVQVIEELENGNVLCSYTERGESTSDYPKNFTSSFDRSVLKRVDSFEGLRSAKGYKFVRT